MTVETPPSAPPDAHRQDGAPLPRRAQPYFYPRSRVAQARRARPPHRAGAYTVIVRDPYGKQRG